MNKPAFANPSRKAVLITATLLCFIFPSFALGRQGAPLTRFSYVQYHMGVDTRLVVYARDKSHAEAACEKAFNRIAALDSIMSDYRVDSELNRLCAKSGGPAVSISDDLMKVFVRAELVSKQSGGAFDMTVGPAIKLWRSARKSGKLPFDMDIAAARRRVGWRKVKLDAGRKTARLITPGMQLDLGGIAKGYACDEAQKVLKAEGISSALVEMGGDIVVSGPPPGTEGWTIRVANAGDDQGPKDLKLTNCAISTSGDTEQFVEIGGKRYSHVIDPRTCRALTNRVQVSLIASDGLTSDPLTKMIMVLGDAGREKVQKAYPGVKAYVKVLE